MIQPPLQIGKMYQISAVFNKQLKQGQAQRNEPYEWFLQIQHNMPLLMTTAVSKLFNLFMKIIVST